LGLEQKSREIVLALVCGDTLGSHFQGFTTQEQARNAIVEKAAIFGKTLTETFDLLSFHYQSDVSGYTRDVGEPGYQGTVNHLFEFSGKDGTLLVDPTERRLRMCVSYEQKWQALRASLEAAGATN
jgi:hypothetical protein